MGAYIRIIGRPDEELKIGGNVSFFGYEENLRHFTLGHGGYLSPQSYFSVSAPIEYTSREGPMSYQVGGSIGIERFDEDNADVFPGQAANTNLLFQRLNAAGNPLGATALDAACWSRDNLGRVLCLWPHGICCVGEHDRWVPVHGLMVPRIGSKAPPSCSSAKRLAVASTAVMNKV